MSPINYFSISRFCTFAFYRITISVLLLTTLLHPEIMLPNWTHGHAQKHSKCVSRVFTRNTVVVFFITSTIQKFIKVILPYISSHVVVQKYNVFNAAWLHRPSLRSADPVTVRCGCVHIVQYLFQDCRIYVGREDCVYSCGSKIWDSRSENVFSFLYKETSCPD